MIVPSYNCEDTMYSLIDTMWWSKNLGSKLIKKKLTFNVTDGDYS